MTGSEQSWMRPSSYLGKSGHSALRNELSSHLALVLLSGSHPEVSLLFRDATAQVWGVRASDGDTLEAIGVLATAIAHEVVSLRPSAQQGGSDDLTRAIELIDCLDSSLRNWISHGQPQAASARASNHLARIGRTRTSSPDRRLTACVPFLTSSALMRAEMSLSHRDFPHQPLPG